MALLQQKTSKFKLISILECNCFQRFIFPSKRSANKIMRYSLKNPCKYTLAYVADVVIIVASNAVDVANAVDIAIAATIKLISNHSAIVQNLLSSQWINTLQHRTIIYTLRFDLIDGIIVDRRNIVYLVVDSMGGNFLKSTETTTITAEADAAATTIVIIRWLMHNGNERLQQGICIIRLISLKRFLQIPRAQQQNDFQQHQKQENPEIKQNRKSHKKEIKIQIKIKIKIKNKIKIKSKSKNNGNARAEITKKDRNAVLTVIVKRQEDKPNDKHDGEMGNDATLERHSKSYVHACLNPMRLLREYNAIRFRFYEFNFQRYVSNTTHQHQQEHQQQHRAVIAEAAASRNDNKVATVAESDASTAGPAALPSSILPSNRKTLSNEGVRVKHKTLRKLSTESKVAGISGGAISGDVRDCNDNNNEGNNSKNDDRNGGVNSNSNGNGVSNIAFIADVEGNGKKCGNPLQLSSQILVLTMSCVLSYVLCCCRRRIECGRRCSNDGNTSSSDSSSKRFDLPNGKRRSRCWSGAWLCSSVSSSSSPSSSMSSSLSLQRSLIMLILLSALWQQSVCFHGSVKLSSNTVKTKYGLLRGIVVRSSPSMVEAYLGIPYASPPVGSLRFMPPITPSAWKNVRNADRFSPVCPQTVPIPPNGPEALLEVPRARLAQLRRLLPLLKNQSEDCLYLNIYVPYENRRHRRFAESDESTAKLSTILFIHGESYEWNSGNPYDGSELAAHGNVIVVTINFRLGIFGFLKTGGKESAQGNFGLMDLVAGLHWLKENLPAFGGDPQSITLLGHGTGAALANILIVSPVASDLIQRTVLVSGSALSPWAIQKNPLLVKRRVAEQTGCHGDMLYYDIAPCLRTKSVAELLSVSVEHPRFLVGFAPFIDGTVISPNINSIGALTLPLGSAIVSTSGIEYANFPRRNLIFCLTSVESYLDLSAQDLEFGFNETRRDRILRTFVRNNYHYHLNEIFAVLKNEYTDWEKAIRNPLSSRDATLAFLSDGHTASSLIKLGYMHSLRGGQSYFLHFKHKTMEEEYPQRTGSVRGEDLPFWFGLPVSPLFPYNYTTQEKQISRLMLRYLANFAKTGNPNQSIKPSQQQTPSSSTSTTTSNVVQQQQQQQAQSPFNDINSISPDSQRSNQHSHSKVKRSSGKLDTVNRFLNITTAQGQSDLEYNNARRQALDLAIIYNQRRSNAMRDKRSGHRRRLRSNDEADQEGIQSLNIDGDLPFWDGYDVVNQLYLELGNKIDVLSHYRGHKLSMWLNLIPQLHKHSNINDQSMRHHQFVDDIHNQNLYEGIVRPQLQTKPPDEEEVIVIHTSKSVAAAAAGLIPNKTNAENSFIAATPTTTTDCGVDGALLITTDITTLSPNDNRSLGEDQKDLATASTGLMGNLEVLRRLSGKQFQSYTTALVATVAVGCFLLILNILIFAGIYHQREKRARDAKKKEELQDSDASKNSSLMKLNTVGLTASGDMDKTAMLFDSKLLTINEYSCYDEKTKQHQASALDGTMLVELPAPAPPTVQAALHDTNWACSTSTLDLLKTKHHHKNPSENLAAAAVPSLLAHETSEIHLHPISNIEMATYHPINLAGTMELPASFQQHSKRGSFGISVSSSNHNLNLNQFDYAVQSSDNMSFKDIEDAVKASADDIRRGNNDDDDDDDDIPEPPPPPRSFQQHQQQQAQASQQLAPSVSGNSGGGGGGVGAVGAGGAVSGGILRQSGGSSVANTSGGKKRVHIQEISV